MYFNLFTLNAEFLLGIFVGLFMHRDQLKNKKYWVFDLDGTLTQAVHDFSHIRRELGIEADQDIITAMDAFSGEEKRTKLTRLDELERHYAALAKPATGVYGLFDQLLNMNVRLGILTRNTQDIALLTLKALDLDKYFEPSHVLGRDEALPKPSPEGIKILLNQWSGISSDAVMIGDFYYDLAAGKAANVMTIHVEAGDLHWPEYTDIRLNDLTELTLLLK